MLLLIVFLVVCSSNCDFGWKIFNHSQSGNCSRVEVDDFSKKNFPSPRFGQMTFKFSGDDKVYFFGGYGFPHCGNPDQTEGYLSDLWAVDQTQGDEEHVFPWKFLPHTQDLDNSLIDQKGRYEREGEYKDRNYPGSRIGSTYVINDATNEAIFFGGYGYGDSNTRFGYLQDMWYFRSTDQLFMDITGKKDANKGGKYDGNKCWREYEVCYPTSKTRGAMWMDANDGTQLILFGGYGMQVQSSDLEGYMNDVMIIRPSDFKSIWQNGLDGPDSPVANSKGILADPDDFHVDNVPGARHGMLYWTEGDLGFLYGGYGLTLGQGGLGHLKEVWVLHRGTYQMKKLKFSEEDASVKYTDDFGLVQEYGGTFSEVDLPNSYRSTGWKGTGGYYFYGGSEAGTGIQVFSELWSILANESSVVFMYHRMASAGFSDHAERPLYEYQNESTLTFLPNEIDGKIRVTNAHPTQAFPGSCRDGAAFLIGPPSEIDVFFWAGECVTNDGLSSSASTNLPSSQFWGLGEYQWSCHGVDSKNSSVCSGTGKCLINQTCLCDDLYGVLDERCDNVCFNISARFTSSVCTGHGDCIDLNNCSCAQNYNGSECEHWSCFGFNNSDAETCTNGNGECVSHDHCVCSEGYYGKMCQDYNCSCNNHGICIDLGQCVCDVENVTTVSSHTDEFGITIPNFGGYYGESCEARISSEGYFLGMDTIRIPYYVPKSDVHTDMFFRCFGKKGEYDGILLDNPHNLAVLGVTGDKSKQICKWREYGANENVTHHDGSVRPLRKPMMMYLDIEITEFDHNVGIGSMLYLSSFSKQENVSVQIVKDIAHQPRGDWTADVVDIGDASRFSYGGLYGLFGILCIIPLVVGVCCWVVWMLCMAVCFFFCFSLCSRQLAMALTGPSKEKGRAGSAGEGGHLQKMVFGVEEDVEDPTPYGLVDFCFRFIGLKNPFRNKDSIVKQDRKRATMKFNVDLFSIDNKDILLRKMIGSGGSASVIYLAKWKGLDVAVKVFHTNHDLGRSSEGETNHDFEEFEREMDILGSISHPFVINLYGCVLHPPKVCLVLEYCEHGDLRAYFMKCELSKDMEFFDYESKVLFMSQVCGAIEYLHQRKIIHRDLKSDNILLAKDLTPRLIDFGISKLNKSSMYNTRRVGTSVYIAPEVLGGEYDERCDIYSLSIIFFEVMTCIFEPYKERMKELGPNNCTPIEYLVERNPDFRPVIPEKFKKEDGKMMELIQRMWHHDPEVRPGIGEVKQFLEDKLVKQNNMVVVVDGTEMHEVKTLVEEVEMASSKENILDEVQDNL